MKKFTFERGINKHGQEVIEAYKMYLDVKTPLFVREAIKASLIKEKALKVKTALSNKVSIEEFSEIVSSYELYLTSTKEMQDAAILFIVENVPANTKVDIDRSGKSKVMIQKRIGLKSSDFQRYFGTSPEQTTMLYTNGFAKTFVDTRIRKCIIDIVEQRKSKNFDVKLSDAFKDTERKLFNISVDFEIPMDKLDNVVCEEVIDIIKHLENELKDFTC